MGALMHAGKNDRRTEEEEDTASLGQQYLTFLIGKEVFAIGIADIREIIEYREPTTVPMMPSFIRGVLNLRGRVVPVIDLLVRFGRESTAASRRTCIVILEVEHEDEQQYIGVVVDAVKAVLDIADADIEPPPSFGAKLRSDFVSGMGKVHDEFVIILDTEHVLSIEELSMLAGLDERDQSVGSERAMLSDDITTGADTE
jgi:purine-binding chemotaxis protein CheW